MRHTQNPMSAGKMAAFAFKTCWRFAPFFCNLAFGGASKDRVWLLARTAHPIGNEKNREWQEEREVEHIAIIPT